MTHEEVVAAKRGAASHWQRLVALLKKYGIGKVRESKQKTLIEEARTNNFERNLVLTACAAGGEDINIAADVFFADMSAEEREKAVRRLKGAHEIYQKTGKHVFYPWSWERAGQLCRSLSPLELEKLGIEMTARREYRPLGVEELLAEKDRSRQVQVQSDAEMFYRWGVAYRPREAKTDVDRALEVDELDLEAAEVTDAGEVDLETTAPAPMVKPTEKRKPVGATAKPLLKKDEILKRLKAIEVPADVRAAIGTNIEHGQLDMAATLIAAFEKK